jgi:hypothetical protein
LIEWRGHQFGGSTFDTSGARSANATDPPHNKATTSNAILIETLFSSLILNAGVSFCLPLRQRNFDWRAFAIGSEFDLAIDAQGGNVELI